MNKEILEITKNFHDMYEKLASEYNYETREDTKVFDINSNNGKLMYATVNEIVSPILKENKQLKERVDYLERSNNRREDIISGQRQEISDLEDDKNKLKTINKEYERLNKKNGKGFTITAVQQYNVYELLSFKNYKDNWNKLKEYCEEVISTDNELYGTDLLGKMQELEQGSDSNEQRYII